MQSNITAERQHIRQRAAIASRKMHRHGLHQRKDNKLESVVCTITAA